MELNEVYPVVSKAIRENDIGKVITIVGSNSEILNMMTPFGTWLHFSAARGKTEMVKKLVELGLDVNIQGGTFKGGALNEAASGGHVEIVKYLLSCGAELDVSTSVKNPLFGAIYNGHLDVVKLLVESGIDYTVKYNTETMKNRDALGHARLLGKTEIVRYLETLMGVAPEEKQSVPHEKNELLEFITQNYGAITNSVGEIIPGSKVAVTVHIIPPSECRQYTTLVTTGMSDRAMDTAEEVRDITYAELMIKLPPDWSVNEESMKDDRLSWPMEWLRFMAHMPHKYNGLMDEGIIVPHMEPPRPYAKNTKLSCMLVTRKLARTDDIPKMKMVTSGGDIINFYTLVPIYEEEWKLANKQGTDRLVELFREAGYDGVLEVNRRNFGKK